MTYILKQQLPTVRQYIDIRLAAGLSRKSEEAATIGLKNSIFAVMVFCGDAPIGIG